MVLQNATLTADRCNAIGSEAFLTTAACKRRDDGGWTGNAEVEVLLLSPSHLLLLLKEGWRLPLFNP